MIRNYTTTIELDAKVLHLNIDKIILDKTRQLYENKCLNGTFIKKILQIHQRGDIIFSRNTFPTVALCDIIFIAEYKEYLKSDYIALQATEISEKSIICNTNDYVVHIETKKKSELKAGDKFLAIICNVSYQNGNKVAFNAILFAKGAKSQAVKVFVPKTDTENFIEAIEKIDITGKYNKVVNKPTFAPFKSTKSAFKFSAFNYKNYKEVAKMAGDEVLFILSFNDNIETFYVAPKDSNPAAFEDTIIKTEAITIYHAIYKYFARLASLLDAIDEL